MTGQRIPIDWGQETQQQVAKALDFDPESPLVKMEIGRILMKGPNPDAAIDLKNLFPGGFGYREIEISLTPSKSQADADVEAIPDEPVAMPLELPQAKPAIDSVAPPPSIEQPASSRSTIIILAIVGTITLGVGFSIVVRKNKNG